MALIAPDALNQLRLTTANRLAIVDSRFYLADHDQGRREYEAAHLPGAMFVDLHEDLADTTRTGAGRHPLPTTHQFGQVLDRLGITPDTTVVVYDNHGGAMASRLWWMLTSIGHHDVRVLNGGIDAWTKTGLPLEHTPDTDDGAASALPAYPVPPDWNDTVTATEVGDQPERNVVVVDSRAPERYRGDIEPLDPRAGHIPGAINRFHADVVDETGRFRPVDELVVHFADIGDAPIVYCGSGVTACHNLLAMQLAGIDDARLFPGSWSQWSSDLARPVEVGD